MKLGGNSVKKGKGWTNAAQVYKGKVGLVPKGVDVLKGVTLRGLRSGWWHSGGTCVHTLKYCMHSPLI